MLAKVVSVNQRDWDEHLPTVMAAYRSSKHKSTGFSPNYLILGREIRAPLDLIYDLPPSENGVVNLCDYVVDFQHRSRDAYALVGECLDEVAERGKKYYDMKVRPVPFNVGDWVYFYSPRRYQGRSPKWQCMYSGPYLVIKVLGPVNVVIQLTARSLTQVVHVDKLKKCLGDHPKSWLDKDDGLTVHNEADSQMGLHPNITDMDMAVEPEVDIGLGLLEAAVTSPNESIDVLTSIKPVVDMDLVANEQVQGRPKRNIKRLSRVLNEIVVEDTVLVPAVQKQSVALRQSDHDESDEIVDKRTVVLRQEFVR